MSFVPPSWGGASAAPPPPPRKSRWPEVNGSRLIVIAVFAALFYFGVDRGTIDPVGLATVLIVLVPSVILHEISHGWLALLYGDRTAKNAGRLTLNPIKHIDVLGTLIIPLALALSGLNPIGYAKPVPVTVGQMSRNRQMNVALVGPFTNVILALLAIPALTLANVLLAPEWLFELIVLFAVVNITLAVFNMIPIPPLDGSSIIERFLPRKYMAGYLQFRKYSMLVLLALFLFAGSLLDGLFDPFHELWFKAAGAVINA